MTRKRRKASGISDEERADMVAHLHLLGWPEKEGALTVCANHYNIWANTLRRWATGESNPPPDKIVIKKKRTIAEKLEEISHLLLDAIPATVDDATLTQVATAYGIITDKHQLLTGQPTERTALDVNDKRQALLARVAGSPRQHANGRTDRVYN